MASKNNTRRARRRMKQRVARIEAFAEVANFPAERRAALHRKATLEREAARLQAQRRAAFEEVA